MTVRTLLRVCKAKAGAAGKRTAAPTGRTYTAVGVTKAGKGGSASVREDPPVRSRVCDRCGRTAPEENFERIQGLTYCRPCAARLKEYMETARKNNRKKPDCCMCGVSRVGAVLVDDRYYCRDCFNQKYPPDGDRTAEQEETA